MNDDVILLIGTQSEPDECGNNIETDKYSRQVFAEVRSIGMSEKYKALAVGMQPELQFVIPDFMDYQDEKYVEHNGVRYKVLRNYRKAGSDNIELVVYKDGNSE